MNPESKFKLIKERDSSDNETKQCETNPCPSVLLPTPNELVALLSKSVIGHEQAKRAIATSVYQHLMQCARSDIQGGRVETDQHVMLTGPSGSGKSLLMRTLSEIIGIPLFSIPCTNISPNGYKGRDFTQHLEFIAERIVVDGVTHPAIVVWDEVDKLALYQHGSNGSVGAAAADAAEGASIYRKMTQMSFLTYFDGTKCGDDDKMDSSRILNIACGAFVGLDQLRRPKSVPVMGFHSNTISAAEIPMEPLNPEHLIKYGLIPEFVGRFSRLATLDPLDPRVMRKILTEAEGNVLARRKDFFALHGVRLEITDDALDALVSKALALGTGARALRLIIDEMLRGVEHQLPDMAGLGVNALIFDRDAVLGVSAPIEHKGKPSNPSQMIEIRQHAAYAKQTGKKTGISQSMT